MTRFTRSSDSFRRRWSRWRTKGRRCTRIGSICSIVAKRVGRTRCGRPITHPCRGCHTALREVARTWTGTTWFIEGDIAGCYDRLDHQVMLAVLGENIHDNRMLRLVSNMLDAGYLEDWVWNPTLSGVAQ